MDAEIIIPEIKKKIDRLAAALSPEDATTFKELLNRFPLTEEAYLVATPLHKIMSIVPDQAELFVNTLLNATKTAYFDVLAEHFAHVLLKYPKQARDFGSALQEFKGKEIICMGLAETLSRLYESHPTSVRMYLDLLHQFEDNQWLALQIATDSSRFTVWNKEIIEDYAAIIRAVEKKTIWGAVEISGHILTLIQQGNQEEINSLKHLAVQDPTKACRKAEELTKNTFTPSLAFGSKIKIIQARSDTLTEWDPDDAGMFILNIVPDDQVIRLRYFRGETLKLIMEASRAEDLTKMATKHRLLTTLDHAAWLGRESMRAEIALRQGKPYECDEEP